MAKISELDAYLQAAGRKPWQWSVADSFMFVADWIALRSGRDVVASWRGSYRSCDDAARRLHPLFGVIGAARDCMAGFERTRCPLAGDVAIVIDRRPDGSASPAPAICLDGRLRCIRIKRGVAVVGARTLIAWKVPRDA
jgi:hypothetical protein